jgi:hypothetical protein
MDNLWESEEAQRELAEWYEHPGYRWFQRRLRVAETQQLRLALDPKGNQVYEGGKLHGMIAVRTLVALMVSESQILEKKEFVVPDPDPDSLHMHLYLALTEWEKNHGK